MRSLAASTDPSARAGALGNGGLEWDTPRAPPDRSLHIPTPRTPTVCEPQPLPCPRYRNPPHHHIISGLSFLISHEPRHAVRPLRRSNSTGDLRFRWAGVRIGLGTPKEPRSAHLAVDTFFATLAELDDMEAAVNAAVTSIRLAVLSLVDESYSPASGAQSFHSCPGWKPAARQLVFHLHNQFHYLGTFTDEDAARPVSRYWLAEAYKPGADLGALREHCKSWARSLSSTSTTLSRDQVCPVGPLSPSPKPAGASTSTTLSRDQVCPVGPPSPSPKPAGAAKPARGCKKNTVAETSFNEIGARTIIAWIDSGRPGAMLADQMGCGKTLTFIRACCLGSGVIFAPGSPVVIVAPAKHVPFWAAEFSKWHPELRQYQGPDVAGACSAMSGSPPFNSLEDWSQADILFGSCVCPRKDLMATRTSQSSKRWPPKCWIRVISYEFLWDIDRMEAEVFTHGKHKSGISNSRWLQIYCAFRLLHPSSPSAPPTTAPVPRGWAGWACPLHTTDDHIIISCDRCHHRPPPTAHHTHHRPPQPTAHRPPPTQPRPTAHRQLPTANYPQHRPPSPS